MIPKDKSAFFGHIRRLVALNGGEDCDFAARVTRTALELVLQGAYPRLLDLGLVAGDPKLASRPEFQAFATWLRGTQFLETAFWLSSTYAQLMPTEQRGRQALFFTPPSLSSRLISSLRRQGVRLRTSRFADPSCGGSAFLVPVALEIARELSLAGWNSKRIVTHVEHHIAGFEIDPLLCELSRTFLNMALYEHICRANRFLEPRIVLGDALTIALTKTAGYDVVISNPPYRKLTAKELILLPETYRHLVKGQPNLYALFVDLSLRITKPGGYLGLLTPTGLFSGRSFAPLRSLLTNMGYRFLDYLLEPRTLFCNSGSTCDQFSGGACPDCIMVPETSCIASNQLLSRAVMSGGEAPREDGKHRGQRITGFLEVVNGNLAP